MSAPETNSERSPLSALARDIERIADAGRVATSCPNHPEVEQLQREIALLRETVAYLRSNFSVTDRLAPVVERALAAVRTYKQD